MNALQTELRSRSPHSVLLGDGLVSGLLSYLASARGDRPLVMLDAALHRRVLEVIEANLDHTLLLSELARHAGVGERHFLRAFRGSTGMTPHQYVLWRRVERAKGLIDAGLPLSQVSQACGFGDQSQLTRSFARRFGVTPGRYRARSASATG
jgi:AraC family transcriptional regulator